MFHRDIRYGHVRMHDMHVPIRINAPCPLNLTTPLDDRAPRCSAHGRWLRGRCARVGSHEISTAQGAQGHPNEARAYGFLLFGGGRMANNPLILVNVC